jgi:hypothetical protein
MRTPRRRTLATLMLTGAGLVGLVRMFTSVRAASSCGKGEC